MARDDTTIAPSKAVMITTACSATMWQQSSRPATRSMTFASWRTSEAVRQGLRDSGHRGAPLRPVGCHSGETRGAIIAKNKNLPLLFGVFSVCGSLG